MVMLSVFYENNKDFRAEFSMTWGVGLTNEKLVSSHQYIITCHLSTYMSINVIWMSLLLGDYPLSEEIAQSTVYHHLRQICVYHHFTIVHKVIEVR